MAPNQDTPKSKVQQKVVWQEKDGMTAGRPGSSAKGTARPRSGPGGCRARRWSYPSIGSPAGLTTYQTSPTSCPLTSPGAASFLK